LSMSATLSFLCHISTDRRVPLVRFSVNLQSTPDQCELRIITRKVVVFLD
jgi:hypothetical protein